MAHCVIIASLCLDILIIESLSYDHKYCRYEIMKSCWTFVPEDRMTFCLLVKKLNQQHSVESDSPVE